MSNDLDLQLGQPLADIPDAGFSSKIDARVLILRMRRARNERIALAGLAAGICAVLPFTPFGRAIDQWAMSLTTSAALPLAIAAGALVSARVIQQFLTD